MKIEIHLESGINRLFKSFVVKMEKRLNEKSRRGWKGWDDDALFDDMHKRLILNALEGDYVDVANLAMFLDNLKESDS